MHWNEQKYKPEEQPCAWSTRASWRSSSRASFPLRSSRNSRPCWQEIGTQPLIVRSSSQLEDNFGTSFAGKYDSHFCPNQGTPAENLHALTRGHRPHLRQHPQARGPALPAQQGPAGLRRAHGDPDPGGAGRALRATITCRTPPGWPSAATCTAGRRRSAGRTASPAWCGGWARAPSSACGNDYPRLVALSHPLLQPDDSCEAIRRYSQQNVDLIDLQDNEFKTLPVRSVLTSTLPGAALPGPAGAGRLLHHPYAAGCWKPSCPAWR